MKHTIKLKKYLDHIKKLTIRDWLNVLFLIVMSLMIYKLILFFLTTAVITWLLVIFKLKELGMDHLIEPVAKMITWTCIYFMIGAAAWIGFTLTKRKMKK